MTPTITICGTTATLNEDHGGYVAHIEIDGRPHVVHATVVATGNRAISPAKWCAQ